MGDQGTYDLYGVVHHEGKIGGGHYISDVYRNDKWFQIDDDKVKEIGSPDFNSDTAYLLFFSHVGK